MDELWSKAQTTGEIINRSGTVFNSGINMYNSKDYSSSKKMFNKIFDLFPLDYYELKLFSYPC